MKVLLRNRHTGHYFQEPQQWTTDSEAALDFGQIEHAIKTACEAQLEDVEVVFLFSDPERDLRLPIR